jgi:hypothetical protein
MAGPVGPLLSGSLATVHLVTAAREFLARDVPPE